MGVAETNNARKIGQSPLAKQPAPAGAMHAAFLEAVRFVDPYPSVLESWKGQDFLFSHHARLSGSLQ